MSAGAVTRGESTLVGRVFMDSDIFCSVGFTFHLMCYFHRHHCWLSTEEKKKKETLFDEFMIFYNFPHHFLNSTTKRKNFQQFKLLNPLAKNSAPHPNRIAGWEKMHVNIDVGSSCGARKVKCVNRTVGEHPTGSIVRIISSKSIVKFNTIAWQTPILSVKIAFECTPSTGQCQFEWNNLNTQTVN